MAQYALPSAKRLRAFGPLRSFHSQSTIDFLAFFEVDRNCHAGNQKTGNEKHDKSA